MRSNCDHVDLVRYSFVLVIVFLDLISTCDIKLHLSFDISVGEGDFVIGLG